MANDQFLKLFPRKNGTKKPHYYQFASFYDLLVSQQKWSSNTTKSLRDVQTKSKGKKKTSRSNYNSSQGNSSHMDSNVCPDNEDEEAVPAFDEDARPMGQRAAKKKIVVQSQIDSRLALMHEKLARENAECQKGSAEKLVMLKELTEIEKGRFELERQRQETIVMEKDMTGMDPITLQYWMEYKQRIVETRSGTKHM